MLFVRQSGITARSHFIARGKLRQRSVYFVQSDKYGVICLFQRWELPQVTHSFKVFLCDMDGMRKK